MSEVQQYRWRSYPDRRTKLGRVVTKIERGIIQEVKTMREARTMTWTPGPWTIFHTLLSNTPDINRRRICTTKEGESICVLNDSMQLWTPEDESNARLIAQAPLMAAILTRIATEEFGDLKSADGLYKTSARLLAQSVLTTIEGGQNGEPRSDL